jgi:hypothetical protein
MLAKNTRTSVAAFAAALIMGLTAALLVALMPVPAHAQEGDVLKLLRLHVTDIEDAWPDDTDEVRIEVNGNQVWGEESVKVGNTRDLSGVAPIALSGANARVQLLERDTGHWPNDTDVLGDFLVEYIDGTERTQEIVYNDGWARYELTYRVVRPVEKDPPETVIDSGPSGPTGDNTPTFTFGGSDNITPSSNLLYSFKVDDGTWSPFQSATSATTNALSDGTHTFFVKARDEAGNEDASPAQRSFAVDTAKPRVTSVVPGEKATGVAPGANILAFFSEEMDGTSVNGNTVKLYKAGTTTRIGGAVSYDPLTDKATFNPFSNLRRGTKYQAVVTTGAKDKVGNPLDQNPATFGNQAKSWVFTIRN